MEGLNPVGHSTAQAHPVASSHATNGADLGLQSYSGLVRLPLSQ